VTQNENENSSLTETITVTKTRMNVHSLEMHIGEDSLIVTLTLTTDLLNPNTVGFDTVSMTTALSSFKSFQSAVFVLSC